MLNCWCQLRRIHRTTQILNSEAAAKKKDTNTKKRNISNRLIFPVLTVPQKENVKSITAVDLRPIGMSWCKLEDGRVTNWNYESINIRALNDHMAILEKARSLVEKLPKSDAYVEEDRTLINKMTNPLYLGIYSRKIQVHSSVLTLICNQNPEPHYVFMKPLVVQQLYKIQVGGERSTTQKIVSQFLEEDDSRLSEIVRKTKPCFDECLVENYLKQKHEVRETMSTALLVALTFSNEILGDNS
ncbi:hypothetical protein QYM36_009157 [Artemia franciscana]|uniref:Uncharacterized protein n=1 Tax=Artemia franciscana TaxID=6661 RepID=A0AA88HVE3_ARTSF|nr:hypothetical protein QYM36_009157 [Artemia franciscana]